jgi:hypothetical protein
MFVNQCRTPLQLCNGSNLTDMGLRQVGECLCYVGHDLSAKAGGGAGAAMWHRATCRGIAGHFPHQTEQRERGNPIASS